MALTNTPATIRASVQTAIDAAITAHTTAVDTKLATEALDLVSGRTVIYAPAEFNTMWNEVINHLIHALNQVGYTATYAHLNGEETKPVIEIKLIE